MFLHLHVNEAIKPFKNEHLFDENDIVHVKTFPICALLFPLAMFFKINTYKVN